MACRVMVSLLNRQQAAGDRDTRKRLKNRIVESDYDLSRYRPLLMTIIEVKPMSTIKPYLLIR